MNRPANPPPLKPQTARGITLAGVLLATATLAGAQTIWTGEVSTDWREPGNWSAGLPAAGNDAIIRRGSRVVVAHDLTLGYEVVSFGHVTVAAAVTLGRGTLENFSDLELATGGSLVVDSGGSVRNGGVILVEGSLACRGSLANEGALDLAPAGALALSGDGTLANAGVVNVAGRCDLYDGGRYRAPPGGSLVVEAGGTIRNAEGAVIESAGLVYVERGGIIAQESLMLCEPGHTWVAGTLRTYPGARTRLGRTSVEPEAHLAADLGGSLAVARCLAAVPEERPRGR